MIADYLSIALLCCIGYVAISDVAAQENHTRPERPALFAVLTGLAWPVLAVGALQFLMIAALAKLSVSLRGSAPRQDLFATTAG